MSKAYKNTLKKEDFFFFRSFLWFFWALKLCLQNSAEHRLHCSKTPRGTGWGVQNSAWDWWPSWFSVKTPTGFPEAPQKDKYDTFPFSSSPFPTFLTRFSRWSWTRCTATSHGFTSSTSTPPARTPPPPKTSRPSSSPRPSSPRSPPTKTIGWAGEGEEGAGWKGERGEDGRAGAAEAEGQIKRCCGKFCYSNFVT